MPLFLKECLHEKALQKRKEKLAIEGRLIYIHDFPLRVSLIGAVNVGCDLLR
jgi:capsule polysaccharide modification protein KpsS